MISDNQDPKTKEQEEADMDNPAKPFANANSESAAEINGGDPKAKSYKGEGGDEPEGPNWDLDSKDADGDTSQNAGVFK
ncbi:MAG: hypothetical protein ABIN13_11435 [Mucilaginibacter sp.]